MIAEPATTLTDYALAALSGTLGFRLNAEASTTSGLTRLWPAGFYAVALAALLGGSSHGFAPSLSETAKLALWFGTYALIGLANLCLLCAVLASLAPAPRGWLVGAALAKFAAYLVLAIARRDFAWVIADMAVTLAGLLALGVHRWLATLPGAGWLLAAVAVSLAGALVQYARLAPHRHFNHNDLFHVVQMLAITCSTARRGLAEHADAPRQARLDRHGAGRAR